MQYKAMLHTDHFRDRQSLLIRVGKKHVLPMKLSDELSVLDAVEPFLSSSICEVEDGYDSVIPFMQAIMDAGWEAGLKPKGYEDASRELTATKFHLDDMRILAKVKK